MPANIFISYSHSDNKENQWLERLKSFLDALQEQLPLSIWEDTQIPPGADWRKSINDAVTQSAAAILLVGQEFLASRFIKEKELPKIIPPGGRNNIPLYILYVGYSPWQFSVLEPYQAFNNPDQPLESLDKPAQNKWLNDLVIAIKKDMETIGVVVKETKPETGLYSAMLDINNHLETTKAAFINQIHRAKNLMRSMQGRLAIKEHLQYEQFFFRYYDQMNEEEHFEFSLIRALTEGLLYEGNHAILKIIETYPTLRDALPIIGALKIHLIIWLNKYKKVFLNNHKMAVCYTGVEDGVPFPYGVDDEVGKWLAVNRQ